MRCVCCLSNRTFANPSGLVGYCGCLDCGLLFKRGAERPLDQRTSSHYGKVDPHKAVADSKRHFFDRALACLSSKGDHGGNSLLDVGCGYGYFLETAARYGWQTYGVEILDSAAREAEKRTGRRRVFHGTLREARYVDNFFDAITLWDVLFLVKDPSEELSECYRIAAEGGIIGIRVRNVYFQRLAHRLYSLLRRFAPGWGVRQPFVFHRFCFSKRALSALLRRIGFCHIEVTNSPLTKGDPYGYSDTHFPVRAAKRIIDLFSRIVFWVSSGSVVIGPSLLVWAEKPRLKMKSREAKLRG